MSRQTVHWPDGNPLNVPVEQLTGLRLIAVNSRQLSALWNGLVSRYHYLGYTPLPGAQLRYLIQWERGVLGAVGFGAAAWKIAARDRFIGWDGSTPREQYLRFILNNARFLILPWVHSPNLASKVLARCAQELPDDFESVMTAGRSCWRVL